MSSGNKLTATRNPLPPISPQNKGLGRIDRDLSAEEISQLDWNLLREDLSLPVAVLDADKLRHNLEWMRQFIDAYGVRLAPHGKTTMAPTAVRPSDKPWCMGNHAGHSSSDIRRMAARVAARAHGQPARRPAEYGAGLAHARGSRVRILLSRRLCRLRASTRAFFSARGQHLHVLVEIGVPGGRSGVRNEEQLQAVLEAVSASNGAVVLDGVEFYEGILDDESTIRTLLERVAAITARLMAERRIDRKPPIISGAGSAWFDVVAEVLLRRQVSAARRNRAAPGLLSHPRCRLLSRGPCQDSRAQPSRSPDATGTSTSPPGLGLRPVCSRRDACHRRYRQTRRIIRSWPANAVPALQAGRRASPNPRHRTGS